MKKQKEQRLIFIQVIFGILFTIIVIRLFSLMVTKGDYYRDLSDNRKVQEVDELASRGNILDRNGNILATTIPSFAVQLYKDQLMNLSLDKRLDAYNKLVTIMEEAGVNYKNDFNIRLNSFEYKSENDYFNEKTTPEDKVVDKIIKNDLITDFVRSTRDDDGLEYETMKTVLLALKKRGIDVPVLVSRSKDGKLKLKYTDNAEERLKSIGYTMEDDPIDVVVAEINEDRSVIKNILENAHARKIAYDILTENNLQGNIILKDYAIGADEELLQKKANLHKAYPKINMKTSPAEDFYQIVKESSMEELLKTASIKDDGSYIIPADILIEELENKGVYANFTTEVITENNEDKNIYSVNLSFKNPQAGDPVEELTRIADENGLIKDLVISKDIKYLAQNANTLNNIYPSIDISEDDPKDWDYTFNIDKKNFYTYYANKDKVNDREQAVKILNKTKNAEEVLDYIKLVSDIEEENKYIAIGMLTIDNQINRQGNFGFRPINLVYNLDDATVLKIEENIDSKSGIEVATIPIRYYPNRNLASHVLGYMGPIATDYEISKYIKDKGYLNDEIIGKTGIEESYQDNLRGTNGKSIVTVDSSGNRVKTLSRSPSQPGDDIYLSLDAGLQETAEKALKGVIESVSKGKTYDSEYGDVNPFRRAPYANSGAVVVSDVKTGEVLAMASYPNYDPNLFATGISSSDWESLQVPDDSGPLVARPMLNIASQMAVMPGSTFKLVSSLAALEKGLDPQKLNTDYGFIEVGNRRFNNLLWTEEGKTWGQETLYDAIKNSCNYYFYTLALGENPRDGTSLGVKLELNDIRAAAKQLGLDQKTGIEINIPNESSGNIPSVDKKLEIIKVMMKKYLDEKLKLFIKEGTTKSKSQLEEDTASLIKLADENSTISRNDLIDLLDEMGYEAEKIPEGDRAGLADTLKFTYLNQVTWDITDMLNIVIGQGQNSYTPLQLNRAVATLSNGGYLNKFTLIDKITKHETEEVLFKNQIESKQIPIKDPKYLEDIKYGTLLVAQNNGVLNKLPIEMGIKTGTAEVEGQNADGVDYDSYAWMIGFAPYDNPEIAISVVMTQGYNSHNVGPIMRDVVAKYFDINAESIDHSPNTDLINNQNNGQNMANDPNAQNNQANPNNQNNVNNQNNQNIQNNQAPAGNQAQPGQVANPGFVGDGE
ncbi:MAG: penicillin-binding transpeptidase domain-containing protein [Anaerococcus sp.]|nr:penicillin-binding transpeptidase domain-containing protein [Peptoniphilaceae bacterium]MDY3055401.1 penicillin-binding transpeptidase domain-containing protein [Anaerococcus sp.]